jgi:hypothetical protein
MKMMTKIMTWVLATAVCLTIGSAPLMAQTTVDYWQLSFYMPGATAPFVGPMDLTNTDVTCSQTKQGGSNVNPTRAVWDDPANSALDCMASTSQGALIAWPIAIGNYEATLVAVNGAGVSPESNRAPFVVGVLAAAPTNVRAVR